MVKSHPFAKGHIEEFLKIDTTKLDAIRKEICRLYDIYVKRLGIYEESIGNKDMWINWDIAKQSFIWNHPEFATAFPKYRTAGPMSYSDIQVEIVARHLHGHIPIYSHAKSYD